MGSFYGNYGVDSGGGGGGGTTNYDELSKKPIINLYGLPNNPIVISTLNAGLYLLKGYYKFNTITESLSYDNDVLLLTVTVDYFSGQKNAFFTRTENNQYITYLVTYEKNSEAYKISHPSDGVKDEIVFVTVLPPAGRTETLYVCNNSIYQYVDDKFVNLTNPGTVGTWGEF